MEFTTNLIKDHGHSFVGSIPDQCPNFKVRCIKYSVTKSELLDNMGVNMTGLAASVLKLSADESIAKPSRMRGLATLE
jgi:hypothetical protein